jgi:XisI protein
VVSVTQEMTNARLAEMTRQEVARCAGNAHQARLFPIFDDANQTYAVVIIEDDASARPAWVVVLARVVGDKIVIEEDTALDKPLVDALVVNGGIPREQIVLAYAGETLPE